MIVIMGMFGPSYPYIQGFVSSPPASVNYLRERFISGTTTNGSATIYVTDDDTSAGEPLFATVNHINVTPKSSSDSVWAVVGPLSADRKSFTFTVLKTNGMGGIAGTGSVPYTVAVFGLP